MAAVRSEYYGSPAFGVAESTAGRTLPADLHFVPSRQYESKSTEHAARWADVRFRNLQTRLLIFTTAGTWFPLKTAMTMWSLYTADLICWPLWRHDRSTRHRSRKLDGRCIWWVRRSAVQLLDARVCQWCSVENVKWRRKHRVLDLISRDARYSDIDSMLTRCKRRLLSLRFGSRHLQFACDILPAVLSNTTAYPYP